MVTGIIELKRSQKYVKYIKERHNHGINLFRDKEGRNITDGWMKDLKESLVNSKHQEKEETSWISKETFDLLDKKRL